MKPRERLATENGVARKKTIAMTGNRSPRKRREKVFKRRIIIDSFTLFPLHLPSGGGFYFRWNGREIWMDGICQLWGVRRSVCNEASSVAKRAPSLTGGSWLLIYGRAPPFELPLRWRLFTRSLIHKRIDCIWLYQFLPMPLPDVALTMRFIRQSFIHLAIHRLSTVLEYCFLQISSTAAANKRQVALLRPKGNAICSVRFLHFSCSSREFYYINLLERGRH